MTQPPLAKWTDKPRRRRGRPRRAQWPGVRLRAEHPECGAGKACRTLAALARAVGALRSHCRRQIESPARIILRASDDGGQTWRPLSAEEMAAFAEARGVLRSGLTR
jgi:hypothetical protein